LTFALIVGLPERPHTTLMAIWISAVPVAIASAVSIYMNVKNNVRTIENKEDTQMENEFINTLVKNKTRIVLYTINGVQMRGTIVRHDDCVLVLY